MSIKKLFAYLILSVCLLYTLAIAQVKPVTYQTDENLMIPSFIKEFTVHLSSNASSNYSWSILSYNKHQLTFKNHYYKLIKDEQPGKTREDSWVFGLNAGPHTAPILVKFQYAPPPSTNDKPVITTVHIILDPHL